MTDKNIGARSAPRKQVFGDNLANVIEAEKSDEILISGK